MADNIIEHLWIGNHISANNIDFLYQNKIKLVINCTKDLPEPKFYQRLGIQFIRLPIHDINNNDSNAVMKEQMNNILSVIHQYRKNGLNVLVHCFAGISRSATTVACYLIKYYKHKYYLAIMYIQYKRPITFQPRPNFEDFMKNYL